MGRSSSGHGDDLPRDHDRGDPVPRARRSRLPSPRPVGAGGGTGLVGATQPARLAVGARRARRALPGLRVRQRAGGETASEPRRSRSRRAGLPSVGPGPQSRGGALHLCRLPRSAVRRHPAASPHLRRRGRRRSSRELPPAPRRARPSQGLAPVAGAPRNAASGRSQLGGAAVRTGDGCGARRDGGCARRRGRAGCAHTDPGATGDPARRRAGSRWSRWSR